MGWLVLPVRLQEAESDCQSYWCHACGLLHMQSRRQILMTKTGKELQRCLALLFRFDASVCGQIALQESTNKLPQLPNKNLVCILRTFQETN